MSIPEPSFSVGIEEEYMLVDPVSGDLAKDPPPDLPELCAERCAGMVSPEFLRAQIEIGTPVCATVSEVSDALRRLRRAVVDVCAEHGLAPLAASTHPAADWSEQQHTAKERYDALDRDLQGTARRLLTCGMHVHVGIDDDELRMDLLRQFSYTLPHLLALSTSSPFWQGHHMGLMSYRLSVFDGMPRTGLPENFSSWSEYQRHLDILQQVGLLDDASKIWWDARASAKYPTIEMRVTDVCPLVEDAVCIAALTVCLMRMLYRLRRSNLRWRIYSRILIGENRWRAMRYSFDEGLVDFGRGEIVPFAELLDELLGYIRPDAEALDCVAEVEHARTILERGTSAHRQLAAFEQAMDEGSGKAGALRRVVQQLMEETATGV